jgi:hypothetical protein
MPVEASALVVISACTSAIASSPAAADADPSCQLSEVTRLLWTVIAISAAAGTRVVLRPSWHAVAGLAAASLVWLWIDMEGPVLLRRGTHGIHLADVPVAISLLTILIAAARLLYRRRAGSTG